jgi:hypothetical protein
LPDGTVSAQKRFLRHIFGQRRIADEAQHQPVDSTLIFRDEQIE